MRRFAMPLIWALVAGSALAQEPASGAAAAAPVVKVSRAEMAKLPRLAILEFKSAPESWSGWRAGGWGPQMGTISNQLRDLFTTELVEQGAGKVRLMDRERLEALRDEGAVENASVKFLGAGVDIPYDGELVNKVFEPVVQRLAPRLVAAIQRHHAMPQE